MPRRQEIGRKKFDRDVQTIRTKFPQTVWLQARLSDADWDGDSFSDTAKTLIDLSAVFGLPAGIRAVYMRVRARDSGSAAGSANPRVTLGPTNVAGAGPSVVLAGRANDAIEDQCLWIPCDPNGDIYYEIAASGVDTFDLWLRPWGYMI